MPTKKKRVGFIPREDVMRIIEKLSTENNLSNSKIISILVEEALSIRGIFNKKNGKETQSYQSNHDNSKNLFDNSLIRSSRFFLFKFLIALLYPKSNKPLSWDENIFIILLSTFESNSL